MKAQAAKSIRSGRKTRSVLPRDLDALVSIDASLAGRPRSAYFERRLAAAQRDPERHLQLAVEEDGALAGFMVGRLLEGEFGRSEPQLRLEAFGVAPRAQGRGAGSALHAALEREAARRGASALRTAAGWREHALLRFLDRMGYRLAGDYVLECTPGAGAEPPVEPQRPPRDPNDYGSPGAAGDFAVLARDAVEVTIFRDSDLEGVARIDRRVTGRDRRGYLCRTTAEALADSALRISLAARVDGAVAGYLMARMDYGDYGRAEPVAVIDTVGVDPLRARQGVGRALVSQLLLNLGALGVERAETLVAPQNLDLLGFFYAAGLRPSERLSFLKKL